MALCAARSDAEEGDVYLHDGEHYALAAKFARDWKLSHYEPEADILDRVERPAPIE